MERKVQKWTGKRERNGQGRGGEGKMGRRRDDREAFLRREIDRKEKTESADQ